MADERNWSVHGHAIPKPPVFAGAVHLAIVHLVAALTLRFTSDWHGYRTVVMHPGELLVRPLVRWDGAWYERIAGHGYGDQRLTAAFWPLYPATVRLMAEITRIGIPAAGILVSHLAFIGSLILLFQLVALDHPEPVAERTVWLVALSPVAFFLSVFYSEALFLLLSLVTIAFARKENWTATALALFLTTLTRSAGILLVVPLAVMLVSQRGLRLRNIAIPAIQLSAAASGPLLFASVLQRTWNDPLLMIHIQEHWHRTFAWPWQTAWRALRRTELIYVTGRHACIESLPDGKWNPCRDALGLNIDAISDDLAVVSLFLTLTLLPVVAHRLSRAYALYAAALFVMPLFSTTIDSPLLSLPRFLLMAFPLFIAFALVLDRPRIYRSVLTIQTCGMIWLLSLFVRSYFVA